MHSCRISGYCLLLLVGVLGCGDDAPLSPDGGGCVSDTDCDDGIFCNGPEVCASGSCMPGVEPCEGRCEETMDQCLVGCETPDADGDGVASTECGGNDCDDGDADRYPGAVEICDTEGVDEDCDPTTVGDRDVDGDGHVDAVCCNGTTCGDDCADRMADVFAGATETCDLRDQDCDGNVDEGIARMRFVDTDGDGFGDTETTIACAGAAKTSTSDIDCDNGSADRNGAQLEVCDGLDNDCDGTADESTVSLTWYPDADGDGFGDPAGEPVVACAPPADHSLLPLDCDDTDPDESPAAPELCNGLDDDCDGVPSYEITRGDTEDDDRDGYGDEACGGDDCDDQDPYNSPGGVELCDGLDNDCDGTADESVMDVTWYLDVDRDGHGDPDLTLESCARQSDRVLVGDDCADGDPLRHPGRLEVCNGIDDDCDGDVDEGNLGGLTAYRDDDGDGFGVTATPMFVCADAVPSGYALAPGDCDDTNAAIEPTAVEVCDGLDNDCDGSTDDAPPVDWYTDGDGDGYGTGAVLATQCAVLAGAAPRDGDCADGDGARYPGAPETCDGVDDDCDGTLDEGASSVVYYDDADGDGYAANGAAPSMGCTLPVGATTARGDCDDSDPGRAPGTAEVCDGLDQDCDGVADEGLAATVTLYPDGDEDGYAADGATATTGCGPVPGLAAELGDCDDADPDRSPGLTDVCNGIDDDCNATVDDGADNLCPGESGTTGICDAAGEPRQCECMSATQADCDIEPTNGCETDLTVSNTSCGACGVSCGATEVCVGSACQPAALVDLEGGPTSTCAIREQGRVVCWGYAIGLLDGGLSLVPATPAFLPPEGVIVDFEIGHHSTSASYCAIVELSSGARDIYCWGSNDYAQLGDGTPKGRGNFEPTRMLAAVDDVVDDWEELASNGQFVLARRANGEVYGWGRNDNGQLGRGGATTTEEPVPAPVTGLTDAVEIAAGGLHGCARTMAGELRCWGRTSNTGIGFGVLQGTTPRPVVTGRETTSPPLTMVTELALSNGGGCARRTDGSVWCWGDQESDGFYPVNASHATQTLRLSNVEDLDCGLRTCCAAAGRNAWCWGSSGSVGQYGDGTNVGRSLPVRVITDGGGALFGVEGITAGYTHMCARLAGGDAVCWGNGSYGQLGRETPGDANTAGAPDLVFGGL